MADKVKVNVYMSPDMLSALKKLAALRDVSYAELVRSACRAFIVDNAAQIQQDAKTMKGAQ